MNARVWSQVIMNDERLGVQQGSCSWECMTGATSCTPCSSRIILFKSQMIQIPYHSEQNFSGHLFPWIWENLYLISLQILNSSLSNSIQCSPEYLMAPPRSISTMKHRNFQTENWQRHISDNSQIGSTIEYDPLWCKLHRCLDAMVSMGQQVEIERNLQGLTFK